MKLNTTTFKGMLAAILLFVGLSGYAQEVAGTWKGKLSVQGTEVPLVFNVTETDGNYTLNYG